MMHAFVSLFVRENVIDLFILVCENAVYGFKLDVF